MLHAKINVDLESHLGLRGLCALWVLLFHNFNLGSHGNVINLNGSTAMPIFFILSGFSLSAIYRPINDKEFKKSEFYRNRFARIYPVYILTLLFSLPLKFTDFTHTKIWNEDSISKLTLTIIANMNLVHMWVFPHLPNINGPSWFVSILWFQYVIFPLSIKYYKKIKRTILCIAIHVILVALISTFLLTKFNFVVATMNIISPSFLMFHTGILAGLWCEEKTNEMEQKSNDERNKINMQWSKYADISALLLFSWVFISTILQAVFRIRYRANFIIQIYGTPLMIIVIISLTLDGGKSRIAKLCKLNTSIFLGKISMSLYLVHHTLTLYFCLILQYIAPDLLQLTAYTSRLLNGSTMPWWGIFIMVPISLAAACFL